MNIGLKCTHIAALTKHTVRRFGRAGARANQSIGSRLQEKKDRTAKQQQEREHPESEQVLERTRKQYELFEQTYIKPESQTVQHHSSQQTLEELISQTQEMRRMERTQDKGPKRSELFGLPKIKEEVKVPEPKYNTRQMYAQFEFTGVPLQKAAPQDSS